MRQVWGLSRTTPWRSISVANHQHWLPWAAVGIPRTPTQPVRESLSGFSARRCFGKPRLRLRGYSPLKAITRDNVRHLRSAWAWSLPNGPNEVRQGPGARCRDRQRACAGTADCSVTPACRCKPGGVRSPARPWSPHAPVAQRAQPFGGSANRSIFVAMRKSFSCNPLIFLVRKDTVA
jgi:hypothetical protein